MRADHQRTLQLIYCRAAMLMRGRSQLSVACACRKSKLYRFDNDSGEWKERGVGQTRLLKNKENQHIRLLMRQEKTLKIRANHLGALRPALTCSMPCGSIATVKPG